MKGIILAGGTGTRLFPLTKSTSKQLLAIYDKPMIYYPLSILMMVGIRNILIITSPEDKNRFENLLNDGCHLGIDISYSIQPKPEGLAQAFVIGEKFIDEDPVCLILGDNIFYGQGLTQLLMDAIKKVEDEDIATIFGYYVKEPNRYGVITFDENKKVLNLDEKPKYPKSNYAISGLYFYPNNVIDVAKSIKPSQRGELEITSVNQIFLKRQQLNVQIMEREYTWLDTGTEASMLQASNFIHMIEKRQGLKIGCVEEIAYEKGYINKNRLLSLGQEMKKSEYGAYLIKRAKQL